MSLNVILDDACSCFFRGEEKQLQIYWANCQNCGIFLWYGQVHGIVLLSHTSISGGWALRDWSSGLGSGVPGSAPALVIHGVGFKKKWFGKSDHLWMWTNCWSVLWNIEISHMDQFILLVSKNWCLIASNHIEHQFREIMRNAMIMIAVTVSKTIVDILLHMMTGDACQPSNMCCR